MKNEKIDFVIIWVDGSDEDWIREKAKYSGQHLSDSNVVDKIALYRDWDNLRYWFRGVEKYTPWVNKIHFVTCGQRPEWLNVSNPKLHLVDHKEYIDHANLPTFSSHPIELNIHKIDGLSERFVYFNDDMFITKTTPKNVFFSRGGFPKYRAILNAIVPLGDENNPMPGIYANDTRVINRHFSKRKVVRDNFMKWLSPRYGAGAILRTLLNMPYDGFTGMYFDHLPAPYLKSTFERVWDAEPDLLEDVSSHRFRSNRDVNQYLMRAWQICMGDFEPINVNRLGRAHFLPDGYDDLRNNIRAQKYNMICINDSEDIDDFEEMRDGVIESFDSILPNKSGFEL